MIHIYRCPQCLKESSRETTLRTHTGISKLWSDGLWNSENPINCRLARCPQCESIFWLDSAEKRKGEPATRFEILGFGDIRVVPNEKYEALPTLLAASNEELLGAIKDQPSIVDTHYLWRELWHRCNHPDRGIDINFGQPISAQLRESILRTVLAQEESKASDERDIVIEAELMRELGLFDEALQRMEMAVCSGAPRALAIHTQAIAGNRSVCIVREDDDLVIC